MPDARAHRGAHPEDPRDFRAEMEPVLRRAVEELSYLLTRDYAETAALKLVGDRYQLTVRQRTAVRRAACSDASLALRRERCTTRAALAGAAVAVDGFNALITVEAMLAGAPVFVGREGALRDLASVHGTYRRVEETEPALILLASELVALRVARVEVWLDRPVGNSGRLRGLFERCLQARGLDAAVELSDRVDPTLVARSVPVASSDGFILERAAWFDLPSCIAERAGLGSFRLNFSETH